MHNNAPLTFKPKAHQRFASGRGVIGNIAVNSIIRVYVRRRRRNLCSQLAAIRDEYSIDGYKKTM
mgnify:CR=1 FL=1